MELTTLANDMINRQTANISTILCTYTFSVLKTGPTFDSLNLNLHSLINIKLSIIFCNPYAFKNGNVQVKLWINVFILKLKLEHFFVALKFPNNLETNSDNMQFMTCMDII